MGSYFLTPDASIALSDDGVIVARTPDLDAREPTLAELQDVAAAVFGRAMDAATSVSVPTGSMALLSSGASQHEQYEKARHVWEKMPVFHEFMEFAFAVGDLMGWTHSHDPMLEQVKAIDRLLHDYFKAVHQDIFASWSATRLAMLADVQALASSARDIIRSIVVNREDLTAPLTVARLAHADRDSLAAVNTFTASVDSGYWVRPNSGPALGLDAWGQKIDDRAPVYGDGTVWDPRLALPTLLYALTVRTIVLKALYPNSRSYCHEINQRVQFLLQVQMQWQTGIRRKLQLSGPEFAIGAGFSVRPFAAGAVDVFTGNYDLIDVDSGALNLYYALGFWGGPLPPYVAPIPPELVAPTITRQDIDMRFETEYRAILSKQAAVAFTRLRWSTGLHAFSDSIKALGEVCTTLAANQLVTTYRQGLRLVRDSSDGIRPAGLVDDAQERVELARALGRVARRRAERAGAAAMADRYALYCELREDGQLLSELRELVGRYTQRERPWKLREQPSTPTTPEEPVDGHAPISRSGRRSRRRPAGADQAT